MEKQYLSIKELALYSSLSVRTLRDLMHEIPHYRINRKILVRRREFDTWLANYKEPVHDGVKPVVRELLAELAGD